MDMMLRTQYKLYDLTLGLFVAILMISNIASTKLAMVGVFTLDGGTILFPLTYIFGDILTEIYGFRGARRIIWSGFGAIALMAGVITIVGLLPSADGWIFQESYQNILMATPRIVLASIVAYLVGSFMNSVVLSKIKVMTAGKHLWIRTISSTIVGQFFDTALFVVIAFLGVFPMEVFWALIISNYLFKCGIEVLLTPATYKVVDFYKRVEGIDVYDTDLKYNPFRISIYK